MIRPLRQRHRRMFVVLGIALPLAFAGGIIARKAVPQVAHLPAGINPVQPEYSAVEWERTDLFPTNAITVRLLRNAPGAGRRAVAFAAPADFVKPDLIAYWVPGNSAPIADLPETAQLLGTFASAALPLPEPASQQPGCLVLYSLADSEIVAASKTFTPAKP
ncbi:MAG TPA: hypothetical protein VL527_02900 [Dongiaceae bacterium]|nr:hypothetical protein [Dongiaceae bacterium]